MSRKTTAAAKTARRWMAASEVLAAYNAEHEAEYSCLEHLVGPEIGNHSVHGTREDGWLDCSLEVFLGWGRWVRIRFAAAPDYADYAAEDRCQVI